MNDGGLSGSNEEFPTEICTNGVDDDFDFAVDCQDSDCSSDSACQVSPPLNEAIDCTTETCYYIDSSSSCGTGGSCGTNWATAYTTLPATLDRGSYYFVADGSYTSPDASIQFIIDDPGTETITIRKAIASDHGTDSGWDVTKGDGQAVFSNRIKIMTGNIVFDGQVRNENDWSDVSSYGFRINMLPVNNFLGLSINAETSPATILRNINITHVAIGTDDFSDGSTLGPGMNMDSARDVLLKNLLIFQVREPIKGSLSHNVLVEENYFGPAKGKEGISGLSAASNWVVRNNKFIDIGIPGGPEGLTGDIAVWRSGGTSPNFDNWEIYGNVFHMTGDYGYWRHNDASIKGGSPASGGECGGGPCIVNNWKVYNNVFSQLQGNNVGVILTGGTGNEVYNNIWYNIRGSNSFPTQHSSVEIQANSYTNNWCHLDSSLGLSGGTVDCVDLNAQNPTNLIGTSNPFVNVAVLNFSLNSDATGPLPIDAGKPLGAEFSDADPNGNTRGADGSWDIGAYEYTLSSPSVSNPVCGNNIIEAGEICDDGNTVSLDGCDSSCQVESRSPPVSEPLAITSTEIKPISPAANQPVTFLATLENYGDLDEMSLSIDSTPESVVFYDDGYHGDGEASDGVFGATKVIGYANGNYVYNISATDSEGRIVSQSTSLNVGVSSGVNCLAAIPGHNDVGNSSRVNIVLVPYYPYTPSQLIGKVDTIYSWEGSQYTGDLHAGIFNYEPWKSNKDLFNLWYIDETQTIPSETSIGSYDDYVYESMDDTRGRLPRNKCGTKISGAAKNVYIGFGDWNTRSSADAIVSTRIFLAKNSDGGPQPRVAAHEFGHAMGGASDPYNTQDGGYGLRTSDFRDTLFQSYRNYYNPDDRNFTTVATTSADCQAYAAWKDLLGTGSPSGTSFLNTACSSYNGGWRPYSDSLMTGGSSYFNINNAGGSHEMYMGSHIIRVACHQMSLVVPGRESGICESFCPGQEMISTEEYETPFATQRYPDLTIIYKTVLQYSCT